MRRIKLKPIIASAIGLTVIALQTANIISGEIDDDDGGLRIHISTDDSDSNVAPHEEEFDDEIDREVTSFLEGVESGFEGNPFIQLRDELAVQYVVGELDLPGFRETLSEHRVAINAYLYVDTVRRRTAFLSLLESALQRWTLVALILLVGPVFLFLKCRERPDRGALARRSIPYFIATAAALLVLASPMIDFVVGMQRFQIELACAGAPNVALSDATIHHLIHSDDAELTQLMGMLFEARELVETNPTTALGMVEHLYLGASLAQQSRLFDVARQTMTYMSRVIDLYGPLLAIATLLIFIQIIVPVIKRISLYPWRVVNGEIRAGAWPFFKEHLLLLWRLTRAAAWLFAFVLVFTLLAVAAVRLLSFPVASVSIEGILASEMVLAEGGRLADVAIVATSVSLGVFLVLVSMCCLGAMGLILARSYMVVWTRLSAKRKFKLFPNYWRLVRQLMVRVFLLSLVCAVLVFLVYWLAETVAESASVRVWLPAPVFGPIMALLLWRLGVFKKLFELAKLDVLALPDAETDSGDDGAKG